MVDRRNSSFDRMDTALQSKRVRDIKNEIVSIKEDIVSIKEDIAILKDYLEKMTGEE